MSSEFGTKIKLTLFGESHGRAVGAVVENIPAGIEIDEHRLMTFMGRRQGGRSPYTTPRGESDNPIFLSGIKEGKTLGTPIAVIIENKNTKSGDYKGFADTPRPSHADYTARLRFGADYDIRGGGHFSGRLTAPLCAIGYICMEALRARGIEIGSHLYAVGGVRDEGFDLAGVTADDFKKIEDNIFPTLSEGAGRAMQSVILNAKADGDSVGAIVECAAVGVPAGLGSPLMDGVENRLSQAIFGLGGVRGIEFGMGFAAADMRGSEHNDAFVMDGECVKTATNNHGGALGGITSGMPIVFRVAFKPTASISKTQRTVSLEHKANTNITIEGRHDPCIGIRALPCVESILAVCLLDMICEIGDK